MNWYKISQITTQTEQNEQNIGGPNINVQPYEPIIAEAVGELQSQQPGILDQVSDINVDLGYGQFGSVSNQSPNSISLNLNKLKEQAGNDLGSSFSPSIPDHLEVLKWHIKQTIMHELGHVHDYDPNTGDFPGGESVAENAQNQWVDSNPL